MHDIQRHQLTGYTSWNFSSCVISNDAGVGHMYKFTKNLIPMIQKKLRYYIIKSLCPTPHIISLDSKTAKIPQNQPLHLINSCLISSRALLSAFAKCLLLVFSHEWKLQIQKMTESGYGLYDTPYPSGTTAP